MAALFLRLYMTIKATAQHESKTLPAALSPIINPIVSPCPFFSAPVFCVSGLKNPAEDVRIAWVVVLASAVVIEEAVVFDGDGLIEMVAAIEVGLGVGLWLGAGVGAKVGSGLATLPSIPCTMRVSPSETKISVIPSPVKSPVAISTRPLCPSR